MPRFVILRRRFLCVETQAGQDGLYHRLYVRLVFYPELARYSAASSARATRTRRREGRTIESGLAGLRRRRGWAGQEHFTPAQSPGRRRRNRGGCRRLRESRPKARKQTLWKSKQSRVIHYRPDPQCSNPQNLTNPGQPPTLGRASTGQKPSSLLPISLVNEKIFAFWTCSP